MRADEFRRRIPEDRFAGGIDAADDAVVADDDDQVVGEGQGPFQLDRVPQRLRLVGRLERGQQSILGRARRALAPDGGEGLQAPDRRAGESAENRQLRVIEGPGRGIEQAERADGVPVGGDERRTRVEAQAEVVKGRLLGEAILGPQVRHHQRRPRRDDVSTHTVLAGDLPRAGEGGGEIARPGAEVLRVGGDEVDQAQRGAEDAAGGVHDLLQDLVGVGAHRSKLIEGGQAHRLPRLVVVPASWRLRAGGILVRPVHSCVHRSPAVVFAPVSIGQIWAGTNGVIVPPPPGYWSRPVRRTPFDRLRPRAKPHRFPLPFTRRAAIRYAPWPIRGAHRRERHDFATWSGAMPSDERTINAGR